MTNKELTFVKDFMRNKIFATKEEIAEKIVEANPNRDISYNRFYLFDLVRANIIYKFDDTRYKFSGNLKQFKYEFTESDLKIKKQIEERFEDIRLCIWNTSFLSKFLNLLPFDYYTFLETDLIYSNLVFDYLKNNNSILYFPNQKGINIYKIEDGPIVLKKLLVRAPLEKVYDNYIGVNSKSIKCKQVVFAPRIEKILVDIYVESNVYSIFSDVDEIFTNILKRYAVNFQKLFYYAKNRNVKEQIQNFIVGAIKYDIKKGEFL